MEAEQSGSGVDSKSRKPANILSPIERRERRFGEIRCAESLLTTSSESV
jgi:hypothetical protein